jgi:hypothetical protein
LPKAKDDFFNLFKKNALRSRKIIITAGFFSVDSILFLKDNIERLPKIEMCIGMHHYDGFTEAQYRALKDYDNAINSEELGFVSICKSYPFHGKVYSFIGDTHFSSIIGSSNISNISDTPKRTLEVDIEITDKNMLLEISCLQDSIFSKMSSRLCEYTPKNFVLHKSPAEQFSEVTQVTPQRLGEIHSKITEICFSLPLKPDRNIKSGINAYNAKGRLNTRTGFIRKRPWYEVELIIPKDIVFRPDYPKYSVSFWVVTDDGYTFECCTGGSFSKNFRSKGSLSILGAWLKGRLENAGLLTPGELVTPEMLSSYGRDSIQLTKTTEENVWLLDFSR